MEVLIDPHEHWRERPGRWLSYKPSGSVVDACTTAQIKSKWIEICCQLAAPHNGHSLPDSWHFKEPLRALCDAPTRGMMELVTRNHVTKQQAFDFLVDRHSQRLMDVECRRLGAPPPVNPLLTYPWGDNTFRRYYVLVIDDESNIPDPLVNPSFEYRRNAPRLGERVLGWIGMGGETAAEECVFGPQWRTDLGRLPAGYPSIAELQDPETICRPIYGSGLTAGIFKENDHRVVPDDLKVPRWEGDAVRHHSTFNAQRGQ